MTMSLLVLFKAGHYEGGRRLITIVAFSLFREEGFNNLIIMMIIITIIIAFPLIREGVGKG